MAEDHAANGWAEWGKFVLKELERLNDCYDDQMKLIQALQVDIAMLKVKSGIWGFAAGFIPSVSVLIYTLIKQSK